MFRSFFISLTRNPISLAGTGIATMAAMLSATIIVVELVTAHESPYIGILAYLVFPGIFAFGLALIPWGIVRERRRAREAAERGEAAPSFPVIDLNNDKTRNRVLIFAVLTAANIVLLASATYKGVEVMDSTEFCGTTCHTVMAPEHTAYKRSPHARVHCVDCHIGPGAGWFVKSKLSGAWQLVSVAFDLHPRPIPTPVHNLRPARETCEQCHWPTKFVGDRLSVRTHYSNDEANTELKTVLLLKVGGVQGRDSAGIHWHVDPSNQIRYRSDETRETIYEIELTDADGTVKNFSMDSEEGGDEVTEWRTMDCVDCHNRPTHIYRSPHEEIDESLRVGRIDTSLPLVRREGLRLLQEDYASQEEARTQLASSLQSFYQENYPDIALAKIYGRDLKREVFGPMYVSHTTKGNKLTVTFDYVGEGLRISKNDKESGKLTWFELAAEPEDGKKLAWCKANARIVHKKYVEVSADDVPNPKYVRFAWHPVSFHNLENSAGLPAIGFRTDMPPERWHER